MENAKTQIGELVMTEARNITRNEESAAAYYTIRVEVGTYPINRVHYMGRDYAHVEFTGKIVAAGYGSRHDAYLTGQPGEVTYRPNAYELRNGTYWGGEVKLFDGEASLDGVY
jgi:hypothetical protein